MNIGKVKSRRSSTIRKGFVQFVIYDQDHVPLSTYTPDGTNPKMLPYLLSLARRGIKNGWR